MDGKLAQGQAVGYDARVAAGLSRGPKMSRLLNSAAWSQTWPAPGSTLDLDFANNRGFVRGYGQGGAMDAVTFTRASNGTYVGPDGLLAGSGGPQGAMGLNLLTFPQDFENAAWLKTDAVATANQTAAPDGSITADLLAENTANNVHRVSLQTTLTITAATTYTLSIYLKAYTGRYASVSFNGSATSEWFAAKFDLQSGTVSATGTGATGTYTASSISSVGNGWYRCTVSGSLPNTSGNFLCSLGTDGTTFGSRGSQTYTGDGTSGIFIWGAQLEVGSTATTYYPTNYGTWRQDWASTAQTVVANNLVRSATPTVQLSDQSNITATTPSGVANPYGHDPISRVVINATNTEHFVRSGPIYSGTVTRSLSISVKPDGAYTRFRLEFGGSSIRAVFDLTGSGSVVSSTNTISATITAQSNGFYRCTISGTGPIDRAVVTFTDNLGNTIFLGDGTSGFYLTALQGYVGSDALAYVETGAQVPTNTPLAANSTCNGILIEQARTNRILWCRDGTQSNWTKTNVTAAKNQIGVDGVANAATSLTASADGGTCIQTITLASGSRTCSVYLKRITGTGTVQVSLDGTTWSTVDLSDTEWRRVVMSGTVTDPVLGIKLATNGDAVAMDYAQVEDGAFATSPILTTTATATRASDAANITGSRLSGFLNLGEGTITSISIGLRNGIIASLYRDNGATINMYQDYQGSNLRYVTANVNIGSAGTLGSLNAISSSYKRDSAFNAVNGQTPLTGASTVQFAPETLQIGSATASVTSVLNGWVQRLIYHPKMLGAGNVQAFSGARP